MKMEEEEKGDTKNQEYWPVAVHIKQVRGWTRQLCVVRFL